MLVSKKYQFTLTQDGLDNPRNALGLSSADTHVMRVETCSLNSWEFYMYKIFTSSDNPIAAETNVRIQDKMTGAYIRVGNGHGGLQNTTDASPLIVAPALQTTALALIETGTNISVYDRNVVIGNNLFIDVLFNLANETAGSIVTVEIFLDNNIAGNSANWVPDGYACTDIVIAEDTPLQSP